MGVHARQEPCFGKGGGKREWRWFAGVGLLVCLAGMVIASPAVQAGQLERQDSTGSQLVFARTNELSDAELADQGARGVGVIPDTALPLPRRPRVILWDDLGRPAVQPPTNVGTTTLSVTVVP